MVQSPISKCYYPEPSLSDFAKKNTCLLFANTFACAGLSVLRKDCFLLVSENKQEYRPLLVKHSPGRLSDAAGRIDLTDFRLGNVLSQCCQVLSARTSALSRNMKIVLEVTLVLNTISLGSSVADLLLWATTQQRDEASLVSCTIPDACTKQSPVHHFRLRMAEC